MKNRILIFLITFLSVGFNYAQEGNQLNSVEITDAIEDQFKFDHAVDVNKITVTVNEGIVELTGTVYNIKAKERATRLAEMVKGVRSVSNRIEVFPPVILTDEGIKNNVETALLQDPATDSYEVNVTVDNGNVTIKGEVNSYQEKELCADVAKSVRGVISLDNQLSLNFKTDRPDLEIENEIKQALKWDETVDDGLINVEVENGDVQLLGTVGSAAEKRNASWKSWVAGVKSVDNSKLEVKWWAEDDDLRVNKSVSFTDKDIATAIKDAALYDPRVYSFKLEPGVSEGWVTLRGTVNNLKAKKAAENLANNTLGVIGVTNRIKVKGKTVTNDDEIEKKIDSTLSLNSTTDQLEIEASVNNGIATLSGTVDSYIEKSEAEWVVSGIDGVNSVYNLLNVNYPYAYYFYEASPYYDWFFPTPSTSLTVTIPDDKALENAVEDELLWSPYVDESDIDVKVNNGEVTLEGSVDSWKEYDKATENSWEGGALSVNNNLIIEL